MSTRFTSKWLLASCLLGALACGDDPVTGAARDPSGRGAVADDDEDDEPEDEPTLDAGRKPSSGADASGTKSDSGKSDAGKPDVGKGDAGKGDAGKGAVDAESGGGASEEDGGRDGSLAEPRERDASEADASDAEASGGEGDAGEPDASTADAGQPSERLKPKCVKKDSQVIIIGDSYFNWISHSFPQDIIRETGQRWRMEAIGAWAMGSGGIGLIPDQFHMSIKRDPDAHTVLMDGGGNDVLVADATLDPDGTCKTDKAPTTPGCQKIVELALEAADKLLAAASEAGIRDVVYVFYPHVPKGTLIGGPNPNAILDYTLPKVRAFCEGVEGKTGGKTRCHFVDLVPVFEGHDDWFFPGDIHENSTGSAQIAKAVWSKMKAECIGQKSGDCCEP